MRTKRSILTARIISTICLAILGALWIIPLIWALGASFKPDIYTDTGSFFPSWENFTWDNYAFLLGDDYPIFRWMLNSLIIAGVQTILYLIIASFAAYALVFIPWKGKNLVFTIILSSMMIPGIATFLPNYELLFNMGLLGVDDARYYLALILPGLGGVFGLFIIRSFFLGIPKELIEACKVDGCNNFQIFFKVVFPMGKSAIFVSAIFAFLGSWNDYLMPTQASLLIQDSKEGIQLITLPVGLAKLASGISGGDATPLAGAVISAIPVMIVYCFAQKYIIEGVSRTGIK